MRLSATASEPALTLYRVTRARHTGLFPPPGGRGRFDDPAGEYRVLYAALEREAAFAEALQQFRTLPPGPRSPPSALEPCLAQTCVCRRGPARG
jgi:hypothetical protein